jgi:transketolase
MNIGVNFYEADGHDFTSIESAFDLIRDNRRKNDRAHIIFANTTKGKGVSYMEDKLEWHYKSPNQTQLSQALEEIL